MKMEAINDSSKLVAQTIEILKKFNQEDWYEEIETGIKLLEKTLEKLAININK